MAAGPSDGDANLADALAICERIGDELQHLQQTLGLEHVEARDVALFAAAGELQVIRRRFDRLNTLLAALVADDEG